MQPGSLSLDQYRWAADLRVAGSMLALASCSADILIHLNRLFVDKYPLGRAGSFCYHHCDTWIADGLLQCFDHTGEVIGTKLLHIGNATTLCNHGNIGPDARLSRSTFP